MKKFTFIGCSITKGVGLPKEDLDENNYTNIVSKYFNEYTKILLSIDKLPDQDIEFFFNKIHNGLSQIDKNNWINMFQSILTLAEDVGTDNLHPGPNTHAKIAQMIINHIDK
jgi:hypothetical protein